jgi:glucosamine--fructose-6-phosphate aminotransferase (isomerizing)
MCGIVGFTGQKKIAKPLLLEGLKRLEYRGYDSAGIALYANDDFAIRRCVGPVDALVEAAKDDGKFEVQGIAHTRWATHGVPSEVNAHPHRAGHLVLVHNGIIENHAQLRNELAAQGKEFLSQTDTEVFAKLIDSCLEAICVLKKLSWAKSSPSERRTVVLEAMRESMGRVEGHYSVLFMVSGVPGSLFGIQSGAPLVVGRSPEGSVVASDIQAVLPLTQEAAFVAVGTLLEADASEIRFFDAKSLKPLGVKFEKIEWSAEKVDKGGYESYMMKEIFQQPIVIADTLSGRMPQSDLEKFIWDNPRAHEALWRNVKKVYLIGCGTAYHAAMVAKYDFEKWARLPVEVDIASEFRYRNPILEPGTIVGVISQSGETADTLAALRLANEKGMTTFSVCNVPNSTIMRESHFQYSTKAGPEIGVASTKAFTAQLTVLCSLAHDVARLRGLSGGSSPEESVFHALARLPQDIEAVLAHAESFQKIGASLQDKKTVLFLGRGPMYPIALEGALKLKEITYYHSEGYAAGELKHGPLALVDKQLAAIVIAPRDELHAKTLSNLEEIKSRGAYIVGIGERGDKAFEALCDEYIPMPRASWAAAPLLYVIPTQLISYGLAKQLGRNIDKPRNLAKSVTVE